MKNEQIITPNLLHEVLRLFINSQEITDILNQEFNSNDMIDKFLNNVKISYDDSFVLVHRPTGDRITTFDESFARRIYNDGDSDYSLYLSSHKICDDGKDYTKRYNYANSCLVEKDKEGLIEILEHDEDVDGRLNYQWVSINDRIMPKHRDFLVKFDDGTITNFLNDNLPYAIMTHWKDFDYNPQPQSPTE